MKSIKDYVADVIFKEIYQECKQGGTSEFNLISILRMDYYIEWADCHPTRR